MPFLRRNKSAAATKTDPIMEPSTCAPTRRADALLKAIQASMATIEFRTDGTIEAANELFLQAMGYSSQDVVGQHHRIFVEPEHANSPDYAAFWQDLANGHEKTAEFPRLHKSGATVWIQATYSPIRNESGAVTGVIKIAADITARKERDLYNESILNAVDQTQAMIEFQPDGTIDKANDAFLATLGYTLAEIQGQHHRIFMPQDQGNSDEYTRFWQQLTAGIAQQGEFERRHKNGDPVFIQATYTPVTDEKGQVVRVVKFATDTTAQVLERRATKVAEAIAQSISELASAASEINQRVNDTAQRSTQLAGNTTNLQEQIGELDRSSSEINNVVEFIRDLSDQTNLLALNATIEAARAGEAGRGFHVVASEVKQLATATTDALSRIRKQVELVQERIATVAGAIDGIADHSGQVSDNSISVAAAVEQQTTIIEGLRDNARTLIQH